MIANNKRLVAQIINEDEDNVIMTLDQNLISAEFGALDRGTPTDVLDWGIYANRGYISFIDNKGYFNYQNINSSEIKSFKVVFYLTKNFNKYRIATFNVDNITLDEETNQVNIDLISELYSWQNKTTTESIYPYYEKTADEFLGIVCDRFNVQIKRAEDFKGSSILIPCPYLAADNLWNIVQKICKATMSRIVENEYAQAIITSCFPNRSPILLKPNNIIDKQTQGVARVVNSSIQYNKITIFENEVTDSTKSYFTINWDDADTPVSTNGGTFTFSEIIPPVSANSTSRIFAHGGYTLNTQHKIFEVYNTQNFVDTKEVEIGGSVTNNFHQSSIFFSASKKGENQINLSTIGAVVRTIEANPIGAPSINTFVLRVETHVPIDGFDDDGFVEEKVINPQYANEPIVQIPTSELVRENSLYLINDETSIKLYEHILNEVEKRYANGIECFEIECLFNDYFYENGQKAFSSSDLSQHFNKYDVIIPYIKSKGQTVPLRKNPDGTPKKFRIIGISYFYDGLLKQKLQVQEDRYDLD